VGWALREFGKKEKELISIAVRLRVKMLREPDPPLSGLQSPRNVDRLEFLAERINAN
jgi:hypothetical protein